MYQDIRKTLVELTGGEDIKTITALKEIWGRIIKSPLENLKEDMMEIGGQWNGDEAGTQEDRAHIAAEVLTHVKDIEKLLEEMEEV